MIPENKENRDSANSIKVGKPHWVGILLVAALFATSAHAQIDSIIQTTNKIAWVVNSTVGVQGGIPTRSTYYTNLPAGLTDAEIETALANAPNDTVVGLSNGVYDIRNGLNIDRSRVTIRGIGTNTVLVGHIVWGEESTGATLVVTNGGWKGTTNLVVTNLTDIFGESLQVGDMVSITSEYSETNSTFPVISTTGYKRTIQQLSMVHSIQGMTVNITAPLVFNFTNNCRIQAYNLANAASLKPNQFVGLESLKLETTNAATGWHDESVYAVLINTVANCWITNVWFENLNQYPDVNNYLLGMDRVAHMEIVGSHIGPATGAGTSHSGLIATRVGSTLIQNNIIAGIPQLGMMFNEGFSGNAIFGNYFTNNTGNGDILCHNTHPLMNLWEANHIPVKFNMDGYFGSASHQTLFRNWMHGSVSIKRFVSYMQLVGNVIGYPTGYNYTLYNETNGFTQYPIFEMGFPFIGNVTYLGTSSVSHAHFSWPGTYFTGFNGEDVYNGYTTITQATALTNIIWGNFTNFPASDDPQNFPVKFQHPVNTNDYFPTDGLELIPTTAGGNTTNMVLNRAIWVTNGWKVYRAGPVAYPWLAISNKLTHVLHGNLVYTNLMPGLVWDDNIAAKTLPKSILYPSGPPGWWGTNRFPAYDTNSPYTAKIPAQNTYLGIDNGTDTNPPSAPTLTALACATSVRLTWTPNGSVATGYYIQRGTSSGVLTTVTNLGTSVNAWTNTDLSNGTTYFYTITASNAYGFSSASSEVSATPVAAPGTPTGLAATPGDTQVSLSWNAVSGATGYTIRRGTSSGNLTTLTTTTSTSYPDTGLNNGTTYYYDVAAYNACDTGGYASEVGATPVAPSQGGPSPSKAGGRFKITGQFRMK